MKLLCLDSNSILNRAFYGVKLLTTSDGTYTNAIYGFLNILQKLLNDVNPDAVACAFDLKAPTSVTRCMTDIRHSARECPKSLLSSCRLSRNCCRIWATASSQWKDMKQTISSVPFRQNVSRRVMIALLQPVTATACS